LNDAPQVIEVSREPIHVMRDDNVAFTSEAQQNVELRSLRLLARSFIDKCAIDRRSR
jgi:hypothetical protein